MTVLRRSSTNNVIDQLSDHSFCNYMEGMTVFLRRVGDFYHLEKFLIRLVFLAKGKSYKDIVQYHQ